MCAQISLKEGGRYCCKCLLALVPPLGSYSLLLIYHELSIPAPVLFFTLHLPFRGMYWPHASGLQFSGNSCCICR